MYHIWHKTVNVFKIGYMGSGTSTPGGRRGSFPSAFFNGGGQEGQEVPLILSLLSCEGASPDVVDNLIHKNFSGGKLPDTKLLC